MGRNRRIIFLGLAILLLVLALIPLALRAYINRVTSARYRNLCPSQMSQIGKAILIYANESGGQLPDQLTTLMGPQAELTAEVLCCPNSFDEPATRGDTTAERIARIHAAGYPKSLHDPRPPIDGKGRHCSYIYLGKGLTWPPDPNRVILYEPLSNHDGDGCNILFADGHVEWQVREQAEETIRNLRK